MRPKVTVASALVLLSFLALLEAWPFPSVSALPQYGSAIQLVNRQAAPVGITVGLNGTVYWADWGSGQVLKLNPGSLPPKVILSGLESPQGVGIDEAGNLYYDEYSIGTLSELPAGSSTPKVLVTGLNYPNFMSVDAGGNVYLITGETAGDKIVKFDSQTRSITTLVTAPQPHDTAHGFSGVFVSSFGDLYYTMIGYDSVYRLPAGSSTPVLLLTGSHPNDVAVDNEGDIFYALYYEGVNVLPIGASNPVVLSTQGESRCQIAIDSGDNVYYTDNIGGVIWEILATTTATVQRVFSTESVSAPPQASLTSGPNPYDSLLIVGVVAALAIAIVTIILMRRGKGGEAERKIAEQVTPHHERKTQPVESPAQPLIREIIKEKETVREVVKIRCRHCGQRYEERFDRCPYCGAPS